MDIDEVRQKAEAGSVMFQGLLGGCYLVGEGVEVDYAEAFRLLSDAVERGSGFTSVTNLAYMYANGLGIDQNMQEAVRLYKKAALRGGYSASQELARIYVHGLAVTDNPHEALRWYVLSLGDSHINRDTDEVSEEQAYLDNLDDDVIKVIDLLENDPEDLIRARAARVLAEMDEKCPALLALINAADCAPEPVRPHVVDALGYFTEWDDDLMPDKAMLTELLLRLSNDANPKVRLTAISSIYEGNHNTPATKERLWSALEDAEGDMRGGAAYGLAYFKDMNLIPYLDNLLRIDPDIPLLYFHAAAKTGDTTILPAVLIGAERWRDAHKRTSHEAPIIKSTIEYLSNKAAIKEA